MQIFYERHYLVVTNDGEMERVWQIVQNCKLLLCKFKFVNLICINNAIIDILNSRILFHAKVKVKLSHNSTIFN